MNVMVNIWLYYGLWVLSIVGLGAIVILAGIMWQLRNVDFRINW